MNKIPYIESLFSWIEKKSEKWYYVYVLAICSILATFSINSIWENNSKYSAFKWSIIVLKSKDLTNSLSFLDPTCNPAKLVFRLFIPLLIRLFNLSCFNVLLIQYVIGYFLIIVSFKLSHKLLKDKVSASLITLGLVYTYFGQTNFFDTTSYCFDGFSFFFIIISMYVSSPFLIFFFSTCAAWNDERAFLALFIVFIFHQINSKAPDHNHKLKDFVFMNSRSLSVLLAILFYTFSRIYMQNQYNMHTPISIGDVNIHTFINNIPFLPLGILSFLEGFWILLFISILFFFKQKQYLFIYLLITFTLTFVIVSGFVLDITRSGSYLTPLIFILIPKLEYNLRLSSIRYMLLIILFVCIIIPPFYIMNLPKKQFYFYGLLNNFYSYFLTR